MLEIPTTLIKDQLEKFEYNKAREYSFYNIKKPLLSLLIGRDVKLGELVKVLQKMGLLVLASGGDGGSSSWIIAVDPSKEKHKRFLKMWCTNYRALLKVLGRLDEIAYNNSDNFDIRDYVKALASVIEDLKNEGFKDNDIEKYLSLAEVYDGIVIAYANSKVKLYAKPCEVVG